MKNFREFKENYRLTGLSESFNDSIYEFEDSSSYKFKLVSGNDIMKYYNEKNYEIKTGSLGASSMRNSSKNKFMQFYADLNPKICSLLVYINESTDKIIGRALLWKLDSGKMYLDRIHVVDNKINQLFIEYAEKTYKAHLSFDKNGLKDIETITLKNTKVNKEMPYIDTFYSAIEIGGDLILYNSAIIDISLLQDFLTLHSGWKNKYLFRNQTGQFDKIENPLSSSKDFLKNIKFVDGLTIEKIIENSKLHWFLKVKFERATVGYDKQNNTIVWYGGVWKDGIWIGGTWKGGIWKDGTWERGIWEGGTWERGTWERGKWENGEWQNGIWQDGIWENGEWYNGTWKNGTWKDGIWENGTWNGGIWENGIWKGGKGKPKNAE